MRDLDPGIPLTASRYEQFVEDIDFDVSIPGTGYNNQETSFMVDLLDRIFHPLIMSMHETAI